MYYIKNIIKMKHYIAIYTEGSLKDQKSGYNTKSPGKSKGMNKEDFISFVKSKTCHPFKVEEII